jgi:hypothetical protein
MTKTREYSHALIEIIDRPEDVPFYGGSGWQFHDNEPSPPTPWPIKNLLPETGAGLMSGQWGTFKTTTALDLAVSVMASPPFARRLFGGGRQRRRP